MKMVLCTAPDEAVAATLAQGLVAERLAACVQLVANVRSIYRWDDAIEDTREVQLLVKTRSERVEAVMAWLQQHHPYEVPEIVVVGVEQVAASYWTWLQDETQG